MAAGVDAEVRLARRVAAPAIAIAGFLAVALVAGTPGSPYQPAQAAGAGLGGPFATAAGWLRLDRLSPAWLVGLGVGAAVVGVATFLVLLRSAWRGGVSARTAIWMVVGFHVVVVFALPLLFSRDVYSYVYEGRIQAVYGGNPYVQTPLDFARDPLWGLVGPTWVDTPAVYGPAFTRLAHGLAATLRSTGAQVSAYRDLAGAASLGVIACVVWTCRRIRPERTAFAVVAFGANPAVLFLSVGSAHNDLLVALAVAVALAMLVRGRALLALTALTAGALVKASGVLPLILLLVWLVGRAPAGRRMRVWLTAAGIVIGITAVAAVPYLQRTDPTLGQLELAGHEGWISPSLWLRRWVDKASFASLGTAVRVLAIAALVGLVGWLARWTWRRAEMTGRVDLAELGASWAWALLALTLLAPVLLPWYVAWTLPLAWLLPRPGRRAIVGASVALVLSQWTAEPERVPAAFSLNLWVNTWILTPALVVLGALALRDVRSRLRSAGSLELEQDEAAGRREYRGQTRAHRSAQGQTEAFQQDG